MTGLQGLPLEIILIIAQHLQSINPPATLRFYEFAEAYKYANYRFPHSTESLRCLLLTSRYFYQILTPILYRHVFVFNDPWSRQTQPRDRLKRSIQEDPSLGERIISASLQGGIRDAIPFCWLPNIQKLALDWFHDEDVPAFATDDSYYHTSPVTRLSLVECAASDYALAEILRWPTALKALHYESGIAESDAGFVPEGLDILDEDEDDEFKMWNARAFVQALLPQKGSLEELILTYRRGLRIETPVDLTLFGVLKTLRIYVTFLALSDDIREAWRGLPPNLEVLEVLDNNNRLLLLDPSVADKLSLSDLFRDKETHFPHLRSMTIYICEAARTDDLSEHSLQLLPLPSSVASEAQAVGIQLVVWRGLIRSARSVLEIGFGDVFESLKACQPDWFAQTTQSASKYPAPELLE
ncbi:hypothetical protein PENDEC_c031G06707 [Penicillium decumbens]|uniref:F-box domain-containing protein n=1 Tax=Penicillium decumbens TaxID=69771 RepID=A0A1V6NVJ2_PENDC|nr:hypothetical protein PENDEC_c031G06707 [Penicillium decumbens]